MTSAWIKTGLRPRAPPLLARLTDAADPLATLLMDDAAGPTLIIDATGRILRQNAAFARMLAPSHLTASTADQIFHPTTRPAAAQALQALLDAEPPTSSQFTARLANEGLGHEICIFAQPIVEPPHTICGLILRITDLTSRRQLEAQLAHSQKLHAIGQLAAGIAHDFNNLLTAILGATEGILDREPEGDTLEDARQIRVGALGGASLVRHLLAFGRQQTPQPQTLAVNDRITGISGLLRRLLGSNIRLTLALEQPARHIRADPTQLDQVIVNLAVNARDAMPQGGELTVRSGHLTLDHPLAHGTKTNPPGHYVTIEVQDTGRGIPPDILPHIFDPFFTTRRDAGGSGLGLSTVRGIINQSEGFLAVESRLGNGTIIRIHLPRYDGTDAVPPPIPSSPPVPRAPNPRGTVLLVEDEDAVRHLAARALARAGWTVLSADSGDSAVDLLYRQPPESGHLAALVSDMVMPGMDGTTLARTIRALAGHADLPVVLVSGYGQTPLPGGSQAPVTLFLPKPYSLADLIIALDHATSPLP